MRLPYPLLCLFLALPSLPAISIEEHQAAFVQTEDELHYFGDAQQMHGGGFSAQTHFVKSANAVEASAGDHNAALNQLKFHPLTLHFGEHAIGVPYLAKVTVANPTASKVRFDAISGSTVHFHCSFFEQKNIEPGGQTTFDVVFLARAEGPLENTLIIHSSLGKFTYTVTGVGRANPYRLRPIVGARLPLNGTLVSSLQIHNPHPTTIKVTEIYSSGGDLHLELPDGATTGREVESAWEIPPFQTRTVMTAKFLGAKEKNTTAYIRIKTGFLLDLKLSPDPPPVHSSTSSDSLVWAAAMDDVWPQTIVLPFEVERVIEVTSKKGLFSAVDILNFGMVLNDGPSKVLDIRVVSSLNRTVEIDSITAEPANAALKVNFDGPVLVKTNGDPRKSISLGRATFWGSGVDQKEPGIQTINGHLLVQSKGSFYKLLIPYTATVITGAVKEEPIETSFYAGHDPPLEQKVSLTNTFPFPLAIYNVSVPKAVRLAFYAKLIRNPVLLPGGGAHSLAFLLRYNGGLPAPLTSFVRLYTNISTFDIPLHVFNGKLRISLYSIEQDQFDFGVLDVGEKRAVHFAVTNENPVGIPLNQLRHVMDPYTNLKLLGMEDGNETILHHLHKPKPANWTSGEDLVIPAHSFAVFEYSVVGPTERALYQSSMTFQTPYELKPFPVTFQVEEGTIVSIPEKIVFQEAFPGKMSQQRLQVFSTFQRHMPLLRLSTLSHDPRIFFESFDSDEPSPIVKSAQMSYLGRVFFFPIAGCNDDCYVGMPLHTNAGKWFVYGMKLPANLAEIDVYLYQQQRAKWKAIQEAGEDVVNSTIVVDTTEVKHFQIPAKGQLVWPRLMKNAAVHFPLTAVGNFSIVNLTLHNPSSLPVVVQLLPLTIYPDPELLLELLKGDFSEPLTDNVEFNETLMFTLRDTELFSLPKDSPVPKFRQEVEELLGGMAIPRFTLSMLLPPGWKVRVRVGFLPKDYELRSSLLLIRNNLTVLEPVTLYGRGARMEMKISNRLPSRKDRPLLIELRSQHLADCNNPKRQTHKTHTSLTVWHPFYMVNTGEVPFTVIGMNISNQACENHGFRILNCDTFHLRPNQTREIRIAFTADFTAHWSEAYLQIFLWGNSSATIFPLAASVPQEWLAICHKALPRHPWEPIFYYLSLCLLIFCTICCVAVAFIEGDRIIITAIRREKMRERELPRFDLNLPDSSRSKAIESQKKARHQKMNNNNNIVEKESSSFVNSILSVLSSTFSSRSKASEAVSEKKEVPPKPEPKVKVEEVVKESPEVNGVRHRKSQPPREPSPEPKPEPPKPSPKPAKTKRHSNPPLLDEPATTDDSWEVVERPKRNLTPQSEDSGSVGPPAQQPLLHINERPIIIRKDKSGKSVITTREKLAKKLSAGSGSRSEQEASEKRDEQKPKHPKRTKPDTVSKEENSPYSFVAKLTADVVNQTRQSPVGSETSEESAMPEWDSVSVANESLNYDEAFKALSSTTQMFALEPGKTVRRPSEDQLSSSSRSENSSDIEASGSSSPSQVDKIVGVPRRTRLPVSPAHKASSRLPKSRKSLQLQTPAITSPIGPPPGFTSPIAERNTPTPSDPGTPMTPEDSGLPWSPGVGALGSVGTLAAPLTPLGGGQKTPSMMQRLQMERKARLEAYRQERGIQGGEEEWPGMTLAPVAESLWDEEHEPWNPFNSKSPFPTWTGASLGPTSSPSPIAAADDEEKSSSSKRSSSIEQGVRLERPKFNWNVAAAPFKPIHSASGGESGGESSPRLDSKSPVGQGGSRRKTSLPPSLEDPSILHWGPPTDERSSPTNALAASLFAGVSTSIWDPAATASRWPAQPFTSSPTDFLHPPSPSSDQDPVKKEPKRPRSKKSKNSPKKQKKS